MTGDMVQLHREGVPLVGTIHDEILALVRVEDAERTLQRMLEVMSTTPPWAPGLPLAAEGFINRRFIKPPKKGSGVGHTALISLLETARWLMFELEYHQNAPIPQYLKERVTELRLRADREIEALERLDRRRRIHSPP